jgi:hypothetical protein
MRGAHHDRVLGVGLVRSKVGLVRELVLRLLPPAAHSIDLANPES